VFVVSALRASESTLELVRSARVALETAAPFRLAPALSSAFAARTSGEVAMRQIVMSLDKHEELARSLLDAVERARVSTAAVLTRTLLEGGVTLGWVAAGATVRERYARTLRVALGEDLRAWADSQSDNPRRRRKGQADLTRVPEYRRELLREAATLRCGCLPSMRERLEVLDRDGATVGITGHLAVQYAAFSQLSGWAHLAGRGSIVFNGGEVGGEDPQGRWNSLLVDCLSGGLHFNGLGYFAACQIADAQDELSRWVRAWSTVLPHLSQRHVDGSGAIPDA
jgi:hypothetical protein